MGAWTAHAVRCLETKYDPGHQHPKPCPTVNPARGNDHGRPEYCTGSADGTLRIWSLATHQQLFEFHAPGEVVTCVAYHPSLYEIAAGFQNGRVRVFDVATTTLVQVQPSN